MSTQIAGVVVLYNPDAEVISNIKSYSRSLARLYVVDNSEYVSEDIVLAIAEDNIEYIPFRQNLGIAKALNTGAEKAISDGFKWLLTMDQDSAASNGMVEELLTTTHFYSENQIGIVSPQHIMPSTQQINTQDFEEATVVMTSGNLLNLDAYKKAGNFREDFFIDYVDHEFCLRLKLNGFKIIINNKAKLRHQLGQVKLYSLFWSTISSTNHNYIRRYYITRNRLATISSYRSKFPEYCSSELKTQFKEIIKLLLVEDDKLRKLKSIVRGYIDYKKNKLGKYISK